jgi:serine phosphatase RsbU (regulator of sigma subunit)
LAAVLDAGLLDTEPEEVFDDLVRLAQAITGGQQAFFAVVDASRCYWKSAIGADTSSGRQDDVHDSPCAILVASDAPLIVEDAGQDERVRRLKTIGDLGVGAWIGYPVHAPTGPVLGGLWVTDRNRRAWTASEQQSLATLARAISTQVRLRSALAAAQAEVGQLQHAVQDAAALARTLQKSLLPPVLPEIPGIRTAAAYMPANAAEVCGDFYDLFRADDHWCVVMGDVCGNGIEAAKLTALARYTIRAEATQHPEPCRVLSRLHDALMAQRGGDTFLTAAFATLQPDPAGGLTGRLCSGGHEPPLIRRADGTVETIVTGGTLLGMVPRLNLREIPLTLGRGDTLLLYTDGVTEARPRPGAPLFGEDRLTAALVALQDLDPDAVVEHICHSVLDYAGGHTTDDTAVLAIQVPALAALTAVDHG